MNFLNKLIRAGSAQGENGVIRKPGPADRGSSADTGSARASRRVPLVLASEDRDNGYDPYDAGWK